MTKKKMMTRLAALCATGSAVTIGALPVGAQTTQTVYSWGQFGEAAAGPSNPIQPTPTAIVGAPDNITQVVATNSATYMLTASGDVWAFGANSFGELGNGTTTSSLTTPVQVQFPAGVTIASLPSPGPFATMLAIDTNGNIWGWGADNNGSLCLGSATQESVPVQLPFSNVTVATGAGGHASYYASGQLFSCGLNQYGQLGIGNTSTVMTKTKVSMEAPVAQLYSGYGFTGARLTDGTYWNWGINARGQLGNGTTTNSNVPQQVTRLGASRVVAANIGANTKQDGQTFVVLDNGNIKAWGANQFGQLCLGNEAAGVATPTKLTPHVGTTWVSVVSGGRTSYPLDSTGQLWACGGNKEGEVGNGTTGPPVVIPISVLSGVTQFSSTSRNEVAVVG